MSEPSHSQNIDAILDQSNKKNTKSQSIQEYSNSVVSLGWKPEHSLMAAGGFIAFGIVTIVAGTYLLKHGYKATQITRVLGLPVIVICAVVLVIIGFSKDQMEPAIALLGTLAGFVLGSSSRDTDSKPKNN